MKLGAFSLSLSVKDLSVSKAFYEKMGFEQVAGGLELNFFVMKNADVVIGLFYNMFEGNIITFNPGWDQSGQPVDEYEDVRDIQKKLLDGNVELMTKIDDNTQGRASFMLKDPDGNVILFDQHVD